MSDNPIPTPQEQATVTESSSTVSTTATTITTTLEQLQRNLQEIELHIKVSKQIIRESEDFYLSEHYSVIRGWEGFSQQNIPQQRFLKPDAEKIFSLSCSQTKHPEPNLNLIDLAPTLPSTIVLHQFQPRQQSQSQPQSQSQSQQQQQQQQQVAHPTSQIPSQQYQNNPNAQKRKID
jgi:hypothetical protein